MGSYEIASALGVTRQRVHQLADQPGFPAPIARLHAGAIWDATDINEWIITMRTTTPASPNVPPRDPERPQDDPYDANAARWLLSQPGGDKWTRGTLTEHLRGQAAKKPERIARARSFAARHGVTVSAHADGGTVHFYRSDPAAPVPYPASETERRAWIAR